MEAMSELLLFGEPKPERPKRAPNPKPVWSNYVTKGWNRCDICVLNLNPDITVPGHVRKAKRKRTCNGTFRLYCLEHAEIQERSDKAAWPARVRGSGQRGQA